MLRQRERHVDTETLSLYIDRRLAPSVHEQVARHLTRCQRCRDDYESLRQTVHLLRSMPRVAVPRAFTLSEADIRTRQSSRAAWGWMQWATALVAALLALMVSLDIFVQTIFTPPAAPPPQVMDAFQAAEAPSETPVSQAVQETPAVKARSRQEPRSLGNEVMVAPAQAPVAPEQEVSVTPLATTTLPDTPSTQPSPAGPRPFGWPPYRWAEVLLAVLLVGLLILQRTHRARSG